MSRWLQYCIKNSFVINLLAGFVCLVGIITLFSMNRDLHPPFQFQAVSVQIVLPGASPQEMEKHITFPVEEALKGLPGIEKIESVSSASSSKITLRYEVSYSEIDQAAELVRSRINSIQSRLPDGIKTLQVERRQTHDVFLMFMALEGFDQESSEHRQILKRLEKRLLLIEGVVQVDNFANERNIHVEFQPQKLKSYEISAMEARSALRQALDFTPIGYIRQNEDIFSVEFEKADRELSAIENVVIRGNNSGHVLKLKDIANVRFKVFNSNYQGRYNGHPAVGILARKSLNTDAIFLKGELQKALAEFNKTLPTGLKVHNVVDGPQFIEQQIDVLKKNGLYGGLFVLLILMLFLNWRTALMTAAGVPIAYFGTLLVLDYLGINIDLISIIGLILVVGILVDDAIIVAERYMEYLESGLPPQKAALEAARSLMVPVTGTILTTAVAFSPLLLIKSEMSEILFAVPVIVIAALTLSWIESFFVLPNHLAHFVKKAPQNRVDHLFAKIKLFYEDVLKFILRWRYALIGFVTCVLVASGYVAAKKVKHDFNLRVNAERIDIYTILKKSPSMDHTFNKLSQLEKFLLELKEKDSRIEAVYTNVGSVWMNGKIYEGYRFAAFRVYLDRNYPQPSELKGLIKPLIENQLKNFKTEEFEKLTVEIAREDGNEEKKNMIKIRVRGSEEVDFTEIEKELDGKVLAVKGIQEKVADPHRYNTTWKFVPNRGVMSEYGLSEFELAQQIRGSVTPDELMELRYGGERLKVYTESQPLEQLEFMDLKQVEVMTSRGASVPLSYLGQWKQLPSLKQIEHLNGQRNLSLEYVFDPKETNVNAAKSSVSALLGDVRKRFPTYNIEVLDADEQGAKSQAWALKVAVICIGMVLLVIALVLGSLTQPLLVGMPIPCGLIGIIWALYLHGMPLGLMALIGLVGTVGVAVNASLIMVDQINKMSKAKGQMTREIIVKGASSRLRAIVLSTLTTLAGVIPMAYGIGGESGFTQPLAFSLGWGLLFATVLTMFVLPALLEIRNDFFGIAKKFRRKKVNIVGDLEVPLRDWDRESNRPPDLSH